MRLNRPVYLNTLRWFFDSPARLIAAGLMALLAYGIAGGSAHVMVNGVSSTGMADAPPASLARYGNVVFALLAWILGFGVIRREVSSGAIQLVMLRPLSRASYVLSKWAALVSLNGAFLVFVYLVLLLKGGFGQADGALAAVFLAQAVQIMALAAVITCLSAVPLALGEMGLLLVGVVGLFVLDHYAGKPGLAWLGVVAEQGYKVLWPRVAVEGRSMFLGLVALEPGSVDAASSLLFNGAVAAAALCGAVALLARREFTYAETAG